MLTPSNIPFDQVGAITTGTTLSVTDAATQSHTVTSGKKVVILMNLGADEAWFGGSDIDPGNSKGVKMFTGVMLIFRNVKSTFKIYLKCDTGKTASIGVVEAD